MSSCPFSFEMNCDWYLKPIQQQFFSYRWPNKNFLWGHFEISSVGLFNRVSVLTQKMKTFSDEHNCNVFFQNFEQHLYSDSFFWISHDTLLLNHGLLNPTHVLRTQPHLCIHGVWMILYGCYTVFWTPLQKFLSKKSCDWMLKM